HTTYYHSSLRSILILLLCFFQYLYIHRNVHPFPTRRSSDLDYPNVIPILFLTLGFGLIGFLDDYLKVVLKRSDGLMPMQKTDQRSEEHTSELQSRFDLVCRLLLEKKKYKM